MGGGILDNIESVNNVPQCFITVVKIVDKIIDVNNRKTNKILSLSYVL